MHDHNKDGGDKWMMWMMIICCIVPILLILGLGTGGRALGTPTWIIIGGIAVMIGFHFFVMGRSRRNHNDQHEMTSSVDENKNDKDGHKCCH